MGNIVTVVVIPPEGDPAGLLAGGLCGSRPPVVACTEHGTWYENCGPPGSIALPLWWEGALVPEGWDRARRAVLERSSRGWPYTLNNPSMRALMLAVRDGAGRGLWRPICLDGDGLPVEI